MRSRKGSERGVSLVEAAVVIPLLITIAMVPVEGFFLFSSYMKVDQVARETALTGAALYSLNGSRESRWENTPQADTRAGEQEIRDCFGFLTVGTEVSRCGHDIMHWRAEKLLYSLLPNRVSQSDFRSEFDTANRVVETTIRARYRAFFFPYANMTLVASAASGLET